MASLNYGRHLPAFLLLFLAKKSDYGFALLQRMEEEMPFSHGDGPAVYRALHELEKNGAVTSSWDASSTGAAKKRYTITKVGQSQLAAFKTDIEQRKQNLEFFLTTYEELSAGEENK